MSASLRFFLLNSQNSWWYEQMVGIENRTSVFVNTPTYLVILICRHVLTLFFFPFIPSFKKITLLLSVVIWFYIPLNPESLMNEWLCDSKSLSTLERNFLCLKLCSKDYNNGFLALNRSMIDLFSGGSFFIFLFYSYNNWRKLMNPLMFL